MSAFQAVRRGFESHYPLFMKKYKDLPINVSRAGVIVVAQIPDYATGMGTTLEEATKHLISGFLTKFYEECAEDDNETVPQNPDKNRRRQ